MRLYNHTTQQDSKDGDRSQSVAENKGRREPPNKLLKIKGKNKKDVKNEGTSQ
jgi:hypothetical protein